MRTGSACLTSKDTKNRLSSEQASLFEDKGCWLHIITRHPNHYYNRPLKLVFVDSVRGFLAPKSSGRRTLSLTAVIVL